MVQVVVTAFGMMYAFLIGWFIRGWCRTPTIKKHGKKRDLPRSTFFSVIIAARNEATNIRGTLDTLFQQQFPLAGFEVHVVDDHSNDQTWQVLMAYQRQYPQLPLHLHKAPKVEDIDFVAFKKNAIQRGIAEANGEWIVTTDADCQMPKNWLGEFYDFIRQHQPVMVSGPVQFSPTNSILEKVQALEFMALIGIGASTLRQGIPSMCNGANLAYKRSVYHEVKGFENLDMIASGDDELLLHRVFKKYPQRVIFLKSFDAIVQTKPQSTGYGLWQQRRRWASKGPYYENVLLKAMTVFVGTFHFLLLVLLLWPGETLLTITAMGFKILPELVFLGILATFFSLPKKSLLLYLPSALLYPFYVVSIGIASLVTGYQWKGRNLK